MAKWQLTVWDRVKADFAAIAILVLVVWTAVATYANFNANAQTQVNEGWLVYLRMSQNLAAPVDNPFVFRRLSPMLAQMIHVGTGFSFNASWLILTALTTWGTLYLLFCVLRYHWKHTYTHALLWTLFAAATYWYVTFDLIYYWTVEGLASLFIVAGLCALFSRKLLLFTLVVIVGSYSKETMLFLAPMYLILVLLGADAKERTKEIVPAIWGFLGSVAAYALFRWMVTRALHLEYHQLGSVGQMTILQHFGFNLSEYKSFYDTFQVFNFLWLVAAYAAYRLYRREGWNHPLLLIGGWLLVCVSLARMLTDTPRSYVLLAPVVFMLCAEYFRKETSEAATGRLLFLLFLYLIVMYGPATVQFSIGTTDRNTGLLISVAAVGLAIYRPEPETSAASES